MIVISMEGAIHAVTPLDKPVEANEAPFILPTNTVAPLITRSADVASKTTPASTLISTVVVAPLFAAAV